MREIMTLSYLCFHTGITLLMDVGSFFCAMFAILLPCLPGKYFIPLDKYINPIYSSLNIIWDEEISPMPKWQPSITDRKVKGTIPFLFRMFAYAFSLNMLAAGFIEHYYWMGGKQVQTYHDNKVLISERTWKKYFHQIPWEIHHKPKNQLLDTWANHPHFGISRFYHTNQQWNMFHKKVKTIIF